MPKWVRLRVYLEQTGESRTAVKNKISACVYRERIHFRYDPYCKKSIWMNMEAIEKWLDNSPPHAA